ncbi:MAG: response regulator receiver modulated metal dependent phosphohydrolase [Deltaproteobacteria bacterium]|nr:response regulator receiver modulated metal dependent phosphohydrolase [Deltaproteobacteria bacterium]MBP1716566.1 response regulator receiver modulated metal dependent phosphohydrolase [Deltaproteobacteria bacterium]
MAQQGSVLVVDDEVGPRESLRMILQPLYEVKTASNGQEALQFLQEGKIDLITLDLKMPGLSGLDVLREIKKMNAEAAVVIITAYGSLTNAHEAIRYGAVDFISKPYNATDILAVVRRTVEQKQFNLKTKDSLANLPCPGDREGEKVEIEHPITH